ncbi:hypothetical protein NLG97_g4423 [Lecanicillium saksenae]|uniref:Uncharacterized protein n=1 Tax=Lecanicillium saksenae TaxID=468837 RepID=A0ACC1QXX3_9HYPO|nr:hypothetical protein NLG97_g4423 [Lecanicillium saksenae]
MTVTLGTAALDELVTDQAKQLHSLMSQLRSCGINGIVDLPQIVVIGEQNAGKSSVLEAISGVRFPVTAGLCTRFATEISFYKTEYSRVNVRIQRDVTGDRGVDNEPKVDATFDESAVAKDDLPELIQKAKERMGISDGGKGFSKDVLCVKIEGPDMVPLTLVDLPGIYANETETQTKEDIQTVDDLVNWYMAQSKSIMLVVVEANIDIARHVALAKARKHDPKQERTLGVVTKPDLTKGQGHVEADHIRLVRNQEPKHILELGWHVLRNRAEDEESTNDRDATEAKFLGSAPWNVIDEADRGIVKLRKKLSYILYKHTQGCLSTVIQDIQTNLQKRQAEDDALGTNRSDPRDQRAFLLAIATEFQRLLRDANIGHYADNFFGPLTSPRNRLRAELRAFHRAFAFVLRTTGHKLSVARPHDAEGDDEVGSKTDPELDPVPKGVSDFLDTHPYPFPPPKTVSRSELKQELEVLAAANEGRELPGCCNSELAIHLFRIQSGLWSDIAQLHIRSVATATQGFVERLLHYVVGGKNAQLTEERLLCDYVDVFFKQRNELLSKKLDELLMPYMEGYSMPLEDEFERLVSRWKTERLAKQLQQFSLTEPAKFDEAKQKDGKAKLLLVAMDLNLCQDDRTEDVIDMMQAYYEMSLHTFIDNVTNLAIESCLIQDLGTMFNPVEVGKMSDETLKRLAAEPEMAQSRRTRLAEEISALKEGLEMCRRSMPRAESAASPSPSLNVSLNKRESLFWSAAPPAQQSDELSKASPRTPEPTATNLIARSQQSRIEPESKSPSQNGTARVNPGKGTNQSPGSRLSEFGSSGSSAVDSAFPPKVGNSGTSTTNLGGLDPKNM